ncbi:MAG: hypothetical protein OHK0053_32440 [Microscillaceae bacterium]
MKRFLFVFLLLAIAAPSAEAQIGDLRKKVEDALGKDDKKKKKPEKKDVKRFFPGYNFSFRFGNPFRFFLYPNFEYHFSDKFRVGLVGQFQYHSENYEGSLGETKIREPYLGGNFFLQYQIGRFFRLRLESEGMYGRYLDYNTQLFDRQWEFNPLFGGGVFLPIWKKWGFQLLMVYNLNFNDDLALYSSPLQFRIGFTR